MLEKLPEVSDPRLLLGTGTFDDGAVLQLSDELALVQSVDFFPPIVDSPFDFGRIAATNALSDLYAMGADPLCAMVVCYFPIATLPLEVLRQILAGGLAVLVAEGVVPMGGHTVKGPELTYGLAVTGTVHPQRVLTNAGARPGDVLVLTKPIGTGVLSTALKRELLDAGMAHTLVETMAATNRHASRACQKVGVHALTDVTGFGLLGHALELAAASRVALEIEAAAVPLLPGALEAVLAGAVPGGLVANRAWAADKVRSVGVDDSTVQLLCDPQTSGGLLAAVPGPNVAELVAACATSGVSACVIGRAVEGDPGTAVVL